MAKLTAEPVLSNAQNATQEITSFSRIESQVAEALQQSKALTPDRINELKDTLANIRGGTQRLHSLTDQTLEELMTNHQKFKLTGDEYADLNNEQVMRSLQEQAEANPIPYNK